MEYIKPQYTRSQVAKAGKILINQDSSNDEKNSALIILNNRRSSHDYPMNTFQSNIRRKIKSFRFSALVVERLKRTPSIIKKLERYRSMSLSKMQDI
jgi:putative GTP pyrophosphokinase